jgi:hypothetical protein
VKIKLTILTLVLVIAANLAHAQGHDGRDVPLKSIYVDLPMLAPAPQVVVITRQVVNDFQCIAAPGNPPTGLVRLYCDSGTGNLTCLTSSGGSCLAAGGGGSGTVTSLTATAPLVATPSPITATGVFSCPTCVATGQTNVYGAFLQDFTSGTMEIPEAAGFTATVNSTIGLDLTANIVHFWTNNADSLNAVTTATSTTTTQPLFATAVAGIYNPRAIATGDLPTAIPIGNIGSAGLSGTSPVTISAAGAIACATCVTSSGGGALTATSPVTVSAAGLIAISGVTGEQGNGALLQLSTGTVNSGRVTKFDANGNTINSDFSNLTANVLNSPTSTQALTYTGGQDASANSALGGATFRGANQTGAGGATSAGGGVFVEGGTNAATNAASQGGSVEIFPGASTGATQGLQGLSVHGTIYVKGGGTSTLWNLQCLVAATAMTVNDCPATPETWLGVAEIVGSNTVQMVKPGSQIPINASAAVTLGHTVCAGSTAGQITDSGGTATCTNAQGSEVGIVVATAGAWTLPDGTSFTATTTLPLIQMTLAVRASLGAVSSVFTRTGAVVAAANDYTLDLIGNLAAAKTFANGNFPFEIDCAQTTTSQACAKFSETTAATGGGTEAEVQITTLNNSNAVALLISQGGGGKSGTAAPAVISVPTVAAGGAASPASTGAGQNGSFYSFPTGNGSNGGSTSGNSGNGGDFTIGPLGSAGTVVSGTVGRPGEAIITGGTVAGAQTVPLLSMTETWNTTGVVDAAIKLNVTTTAEGAGSLLMDLQSSTVSKFTVDFNGLTTAANIIQSTVGTQTVTGADYTNTTTTPSTVFSWTLPATAVAKNYRYTCDIMWESTAATLVGPVFGVNISAAPTQLTAAASVQNTLAGADVNGYLSNTTTGSQTLVTSAAAGVTSTNYWAKIWGTIEGAAVAGSTFIINAASTSGTTASLNIRRGSGCYLN